MVDIFIPDKLPLLKTIQQLAQICQTIIFEARNTFKKGQKFMLISTLYFLQHLLVTFLAHHCDITLGVADDCRGPRDHSFLF
jgi:hypothetical protein